MQPGARDEPGMKSTDDQINHAVMQVGKMILMGVAIMALFLGLLLAHFLLRRLTGFGLPENLFHIVFGVFAFRIAERFYGKKPAPPVTSSTRA